MVRLSNYTGKTALVAAPTGDRRVLLRRITSRGTEADHLWLSVAEAELYAQEILDVVMALRNPDFIS